jgi:hypothetical protein
LGSGEAMRIDSSGNVGIGTTSADEVLEVAGDVKSSGGNFGIYHFGETSDVTKIVGRDGGHGSFPNTMDFFTNSAQRMRIDSSGNLLVGNTNRNTIVSNGASGVAIGGDGFIGASRAGDVLVLNRENSNGNVAAFRLDGTQRGNIAIVGTTTYYNTSSDQRLKQNIQDADDAGSKIDAIQIRQFDWIEDNVHQDYGVIAQELKTVAPEAVYTPEDAEEEMMSVDCSKLVPMLIKELQTLRNRVAQLENN